MDAMLTHIHNHENKLRDAQQSSVGRFFTGIKLFFLYVGFALHRSVILLFAHPTKSFMMVHAQGENGVWNASYEEHVRFQHRIRFFSASSLCVLFTSIAIVWSVLNVVFPSGNTPVAYAAVNTFFVTNANDSGAGSLRQALISANGSGAGDTNNIQFDVVGQPTLLLASLLPPVSRHVEFVNPNAAIAMIIDGTNLGAPSSCLSLNNGSSNSIIKGVAFKDCNTAINVNGNPSNILIGNDGDLNSDRVQIWGGNTGIILSMNVTNTIIKNVVIGQNLSNSLRAVNGTGIRIDGSNNTVTKTQIGKTNEGIRIQGSNNTVKKSYIGIAYTPVADVNIGNNSWGIYVQGNNNTIGGTNGTDSNVISYNTGAGVSIQNGASGNKVLQNYIGLNGAGTAAAGNTSDGIFVNNAGTNYIGDSVSHTGPVVSGNGQRGISVASASVFINSTIIGLSANQSASIGNNGGGVNVNNLGQATTMEMTDSVVAGNGNAGIFFNGNTSGKVLSSFIGTNASQSATFANNNSGITASGGNINIGENNKGNVIRGNNGSGISLNNLTGPVNITEATIVNNVADGIVMSNSGQSVTISEANMTSNGGVAAISLFNTNNVTIADSTITGDLGDNTHGVKLNGATNISLHDNIIQGHKIGGVDIVGNVTVSGNNLTVRQNQFGLITENAASGSWEFSNSTFDGNNTGASLNSPNSNAIISLHDSSFSDNVGVMGGQGFGLQLAGVANASITANTITGNGFDGISLVSSTLNTITGNNISDNGTSGISLGGSSDNNTILSNIISGAATGGIVLINSDHNTIGNGVGGGNTIVSSGTVGIILDQNTDSNNVVGNYVGTNSNGDVLGNARGMQDDGANNSFTKNTVANSTNYGLVITGQNGVYTENVITANAFSGILVEGTATGSNINKNFIGVTGDLAVAGNAQDGILVQDGATDINIGGGTNGNTIAQNGGNGVTVDGASTSHVLVARNDIYGNGALGIDLQNGANNNIQAPDITVANATQISGNGGYVDGVVELFANGVFIGRDETIASDGNWSLSADDYLQPYEDIAGQTVTATNIDSDNNTSEFSEGVVLSANTIIGDVAVETTDTSATITVTTSPATTAELSYGTAEDNLSETLADTDSDTEHVFELTGLSSGTTYYYQVDVNTEDDTTESTDVESFTTDGEAGDIAVSAHVVTAETSATLEITTDPATTVEVQYGTSSGNLSSSKEDNTLSTTHTLTLNSLSVATTYYYRIVVTAEDDTTGMTDIATFKTTNLDFAYASNTYVNGQRAFNPSTNLYVAPGGVRLKITPANNAHDVQVTVRDTNKNVVLQGDWLHVNNQKFLQVLQGLQKNQKYTVHAQARISDTPSARSEKEKVSTFTMTRKAPTITSLAGDYTVTSNTQSLDFSGLTQNNLDSQFRFQNAMTGQVVATCGSPCALPFALPAGVYNVLYESLKNGVPSAPAMHTMVVTRAKITSVLNTDPRNDTFVDRIVASNRVTVVGLGPKGATATVYVDGKSVGTATYTTDIGWQFSLDLSGLDRNADHLLEVKYTTGNGKQAGVSVYYPFQFIDTVQTPVVSDLAAEYQQTANFTFTVTGGTNDRINVTRDGELVYATDLVNGTAEVPVLTDTLGQQTLRIQAENSIGIDGGTAIATYNVVTQITEQNNNEENPGDTDNENTNSGNENTNSGNTNNGNTNNGNTNSGNENTNSGNSNTNSGSTNGNTNTGNENTNSGSTNGNTNAGTTNGNTNSGAVNNNTNTGSTNGNTNSNNGGNIGGIDEEDIPEEYRRLVTDPLLAAQIKKTIDTQNLLTVTLGGEQQSADLVTGEVVETKVIGKNSDGVQVLRNIDFQGITVDVPFFSHVFNFFTKQISDVLVVEGQSEPYAVITLTIHSDPIVQVTRADNDGKWTMTVPASVLPEGEHTAYIATESRGVESDQVEIAKFVVVEEKSISNTTWIFIINLSIAIILLIVAITLQIRGKNKRKLQPVAAAPVVKKVSATPVVKKGGKDDDDTPDYHSALGV